MLPLKRMLVPILLPCALLLTGCGSSFQVVKPTIDGELLQPCRDPQLAPPDNPSDNELAAERLRVAKVYLDYKSRHATLADRVK